MVSVINVADTGLVNVIHIGFIAYDSKKLILVRFIFPPSMKLYRYSDPIFWAGGGRYYIIAYIKERETPEWFRVPELANDWRHPLVQ